MKTAFVWIVLLIRFVWAVLTGGLETLLFILEQALGRSTPPAGLVEISFPAVRPEGITLLAWMISLTPGTTVLNVKQEERVFRLHMLDLRNFEKTRNSIEKHFFPGVVFLFGTQAPGERR